MKKLYIRSAIPDDDGNIVVVLSPLVDNSMTLVNGNEIANPANTLVYDGKVIVDLTEYAADYEKHPANSRNKVDA